MPTGMASPAGHAQLGPVRPVRTSPWNQPSSRPGSGCASCPRCRSARSGALCGVGALAAVRRSGAGGAERDRSGHGAALLRRRRRALPRGRASKRVHVIASGMGRAPGRPAGRRDATGRRGDRAASALTGEPHPETVVATMPTETLSLGRDRFEALLDRWPDVRANVLRIVYRRFARSLAHGPGSANAARPSPCSSPRPRRGGRRARRGSEGG